MASPFLNITPVTAGQNNKEITINDADLALEQATQATLSVDMSGGNVTLTVAQFTRFALFSTESAVAIQDLVVPSDVGEGANTARRMFYVQNPSGFNITVKVLGQPGVAVPPGNAGVLSLDGTDVSIVFLSDSGSVETILDWKNSVRATTTANGALATAYEDGDTIDGVVIADGDRILLKDQTDASENGIYIVNATGAPTRASDANVDSKVTPGMAVVVEEGTTHANQLFLLSTNAPIILDTTGLTFTALSGAASGPNDNLAATTNPGIDDDLNQTSPGPYGVGSKWVNVVLDRAYICVDASDGAAVWNQVASVFTALEDTPADYTGHAGKNPTVNGTEDGLEFISPAYDIQLGFAATPTSDQILETVLIPRQVNLPADLVGSLVSVGTNPTATYVLLLQDDASTIATISIDTSGVATFATTGGTAQTIASGSTLTLVGATVVDATIADMVMTLFGSL